MTKYSLLQKEFDSYDLAKSFAKNKKNSIIKLKRNNGHNYFVVRYIKENTNEPLATI